MIVGKALETSELSVGESAFARGMQVGKAT